MHDLPSAVPSGLSNAHHFIAVILPLFYKEERLHLLFDTKQHIDAGYGKFAKYLPNSESSYPGLWLLWTEIKNQKHFPEDCTAHHR
jgi:hypothetical protein